MVTKTNFGAYALYTIEAGELAVVAQPLPKCGARGLAETAELAELDRERPICTRACS